MAQQPPPLPPLVEENLAEALIHRQRPHKILGLKLRPFSCWHAAQLDWICSPFAGHPGSVNLSALYLAARVCQTRFPHRPHRSLTDNYWRELWCAWRYPSKWVLTPDRSGVTSRLSIELNKFSLYLRDYSGAPEYVVDEETAETHRAKTPWYLHQVAALAQGRIDARATAWDLPMGEGNWWLAAAAEAAGHKIDLITPADRAQLQELGINDE